MTYTSEGNGVAEGGGEEQAADTRSGTPDVFISYASPDSSVADAACAAMEREGLSCWIAPRDVVPGESYASAIVHAIDATKVIVLVLSENAATSQHVLKEVERASSKRHPVIAFRIDLAPMPADLEYFLNTSQWLDASALGVERALPKLVDAVRRVVVPPAVNPPVPSGTSAVKARAASPELRRNRFLFTAAFAAVMVALAWLLADKFWISKHLPTSQSVMSAAQETTSRANMAPAGATPATPAPAAFAPPPHSIAVLPFVNMSGDKEQDYFSDGLTEELLNSLARINELQVAARTSAFSFKGKDTDIGTIARKLNVGAVLEGSVRRSAHTVRITAQLINAVTGFHVWSQTYDRDLGDVLKLQTDIANAVASALKVTLLGDEAAKIEIGGTRNPPAFDAYLRGSKAYATGHDAKDYQTAIAAFAEATRLDPDYALAFADRSLALSAYAGDYAIGPAIRESFEQAQTDARKATMLAPSLAEAHLALAQFLSNGSLDSARANAEYDRAAALAPGDARVLRAYGHFAALMGRFDAGIASARRGVSLDPLNHVAYNGLGVTLLFARRYNEAIAAFRESLTLDPDDPEAHASRGLADYALGTLQDARASCEIKPDYWTSQLCLAVTYDKLGRHGDAETVLVKMQASNGDDAAYQYAEIYAQWGNAAKALEWLGTAMRVRDPGLIQLKTDSLLDPLRQESRFQAIERALKFPT
jgi:TolB-like protein/lipoprotein NlpI